MSTPSQARRPERVAIEGRYVRLEPAGPQHAADLYAAAGAERYRWLPIEPPAGVAELEAVLAEAARRDDPLVFAVIDRASGRCVGRQSYMRITPEHGSVEIGGVLWGEAMARTRLATEAQYLFARHAFDTLGYRRYEWKCDDLNTPSKAAARRFGFTYEGTFRQHMIVKGRSRDTAWFAMLDGDWPQRRAEYERWLDPANFDADGGQKTKLRFDR